jgi:hypothetical protein
MQQITVHRQDGSQFQTLVNHLAHDMGYAVVHRGQDELVIVEGRTGGDLWREVKKYQRGDTLAFALRSQDQPRSAEVIHVLQQTSDTPLTYVVIAEGQWSPEVVAPCDIIEDERESEA